MISSLSSSSSYSAATVRVEKATSDLLIGPDWTMNMGICDSINSNHWEAKDVVKALKKRLQHKNPTVQLLALTLLETMVKNCGDYVHLQIAEKNILPEMIKIVKKKTHIHVRDKILVLIDSWQEAFGGAGGKYPQYYWAYEELRRYGVGFPPRSSGSAPIFTPPVTHSSVRPAQAGYGMPINSSTRLDEAMAAEMENLSVSSINSMRDVLDLLADMLQAVNPSDRESVKDEVIVDLVNQCRSNQKKLMHMLTTTGDEELLVRGLELNDNLQIVLAKNDAISSGSPLPTPSRSFLRPAEPQQPSQASSANSSAPVAAAAASASAPKVLIQEDDEEEEDDFAQLARRHSKTKSTSQDMSTASSGSVTPTSNFAEAAPAALPSSSPNSCTALALPDPPSSVKTTKEQDMIDFLSLTLSTMGTASPRSPYSPNSSSENFHQAGISQTMPNYPSQPHNGNQGQVPFNSYVVPWAQTQPQPQPQSYAQPQPQRQPQPQSYVQPQPQHQPQPQSYVQPQPQHQPQNQPQPQSYAQPQPQPQSYAQPQQRPQSQHQPQPQPRSYAHYQPYSQPHLQTQPEVRTQPQPQAQPQYSLPPPPWAATPGYYSNQNYLSSASYTAAVPRTNPTPFAARGSDATSMNGETRISSDQRTTATAGQKAFVPSYRLFEDLNVLGNGDGRLKMTNNGYNAAGPSTQGMVGGRK